jgi:hypothetical protein
MKHLVAGSFALGVVAASTLLTSDARAGAQYGAWEYCATGACEGTYMGFRNSPNPNDYVEFFINPNPGFAPGVFYASYAGNFYTCYVPTTGTELAAAFLAAPSMSGGFYISWNSSGQCTFLQLNQDSAYSQTW